MNEVYASALKDDWTLIILHLLSRPLYTIILLSVRRDIHATVIPRSASTAAVNKLGVSTEKLPRCAMRHQRRLCASSRGQQKQDHEGVREP